MAIFGSPFGLDPRRRLLAEQGLAGGDDMDLMKTPPFTPSPTFPRAAARPETSDILPDLPIARGAAPNLPDLSPAPSLSELRSPLPVMPLRRPPAMPRPAAPPVAPAGAIAPKMDLSSEGVPIPALPGRPGGPQPYNPIAEAEYKHVMKGATSPAGGFKRSGKDILINALLGGLQGMAGGDGLGGFAGGALAAGAGAAISPMRGREYQFDRLYRPKMEREMAERMTAEDRARAIAAGALKNEETRAQISGIESQNKTREEQSRLERDKFNLEQGKIVTGRPGERGFKRNPRTGKYEQVFEVPAAEKPPTAAELDVDPDTGRSWQEQADFAYNDRGGDQYVYDRLPERTRRILESEPGALAPAEVAAAQREFQTAISRQRQLDREYSRGAIRAKHARGKKGQQIGRKGTPGRAAISVKEAADLLR